MKNITVDMIMDAKPCKDYPRDRVEKLFASRKSLTLDELFDLDIPASNRWWAFIYCGMTTDRNYRLIACDIVEEITMPIWSKHYPDDESIQVVIDIARKYIEGQITLAEMTIARNTAQDRFWNTSWNVTIDSAKDAAWSIVMETTWDAIWTSAGDAVWNKIFNIARRYQNG